MTIHRAFLQKIAVSGLALSILLALILFAGDLHGQSFALDKFIDSYVKENNFNGTILIQQRSNVLYHKSFGLADFQLKVPNKNQTKYKAASITKLFTSVLIMQAYEKGEINLNSTIETYLPDYKGEGADKVTIHQLLNHTSGMTNMDTVTTIESALENGVPIYQTPLTSDALLTTCCSGKLVNAPGKVFDYNNADYVVLGKIIEKVYKKTYEQVLHENILRPLKLTRTGLLYQHNIIDDLADTYFYRDDLKKLVPDLPVYIENWYAAGSMYSTANDILQFSNALFGLKLLQQDALNKMFTSGLGEYGYGVWVYEDYDIKGKKYKIIKRPGLIMGAQAMLFHVLDGDSTIIMLSNTGTTSLDDFAAKLADQILQ